MSETHDIDGTFEEGSDQDSSVIKELRAQVKQLKAASAEKDKRLAEVEARETTKREQAAEDIVNSLGFPGLKDDVLGWVEGEITAAAVTEALKARSITVTEGEPLVTEQADDDAPVVSASNVGQRVADAAGGRDARSLEERLAAATTNEEIAAIMDEAGAVTRYA